MGWGFLSLKRNFDKGKLMTVSSRDPWPQPKYGAFMQLVEWHVA